MCPAYYFIISKFKVMQFVYFIGIDMSKEWFDAYLLNGSLPKSGEHKQFDNDRKGFKSFKTWMKQQGVKDFSQAFICMEHTGVYTVPLCQYLNSIKAVYTLIAGLEIKRSMGISRGKNDKVDAKRIAHYAYKERDFIRIYTLPSQAIRSLRTMLSLRRRLQKAKHAFKVSNKELQEFEVLEIMTVLDQTTAKMLQSIENQLVEVDRTIDEILQNHPCIKRNYELLCSVPGIGRWISLYLIVYTQNFVSFRTSRKFASYGGIAPFADESGKHKAKSAHVSHIANKRIKAILTNGAYAAVQNYAEFKTYFDQQIEKGKNEFSVINAVKNKLLHRAFAVIRRNEKYAETYAFHTLVKR